MRRFLSLLLVFTLGIWPLAAQVRRVPGDDPDPGPTASPSIFQYDASNGFSISVAWHGDHLDVIGRSRVAEAVTVHVQVDGETIEHRYGDATLRTWLDASGQAVWE